MLANAIAGELVKTWLLPFASTLGAGLVGWLQEVPLFYMFVGLALFFAAVSTGLLRFTEWQYRNRVVDKLVFKSLRVAPNILNAASVDLVRFGFLLSNKSEFPIQFEIEKLHTSFGDYYAPKKDYKRNSITIPPHGDGWFDDHNISVGEPLVGSEKGIIGISAEIRPAGKAASYSRAKESNLLWV